MGVLTVHPSPATGAVAWIVVETHEAVREFLTSRRAKISPERAGLPAVGHRRVPGLRRSEVAALAGMSVEYYAQLERGSLKGASVSVLDALARALQLDDAERAHLFRLAQAADGTTAAMRPRRARRPWRVPPSLQQTLDCITAGAAVVSNNRSDLLAVNHLGRALYSDLYADPTGQPNFLRFAFLDAASHRFFADWELTADTCVANLRTAAGQDPHDKALHDLVGELSTRSEEFRRRWGSHNVRTHGEGVKHFHHHVVGVLDLTFESFDLRGDPGLSLTILTAEPGSPSAHALAMLGSWAATVVEADADLP